MKVLYVTNNGKLAGTTRVLLSWLTLGSGVGLSASVVVGEAGPLPEWLAAHDVPHAINSMPWIDWRWPAPALREALKVRQWARRQGIEVVHCNEHNVYPFGVLLARLLHVPVVCHVRFRLDRGFSSWAFGGWRRPDALLWTTRQQQEDSATAVDGVVPPSVQHLIPLGPDATLFRPDPDERGLVRQRFDIREGEIAIGTTAALRPIKKLDDFISVVGKLAETDPRVIGLIAGGVVPGDEACAAEIHQLIAASGLGRRLRWLGHLEPVVPLLQSLDIFVSTSLYETFGNSVAEAMACELPVAAYVGGSVHEVLGDAGLLVPNEDRSGLTRCLDLLIHDLDARRRYGRLARFRASTQFDPRTSFRCLAEVYRQVLERTA